MKLLALSEIKLLSEQWRFLSLNYDEDVRESYKMIHQAVQFLAITGKSILPPRSDDSHTSFAWDNKKDCFYNELFDANRTFKLEFYPSNLYFILTHDENPIDSMCLVGKTKKDIYAQLRHMLAKARIVVNHFSMDMHYDIPEHMVCRGGKYSIKSIRINEEVIKYYSNAYLVLSLLQGGNYKAGKIRCWPHHFDITSDFSAMDENEENSIPISVGFSPANPDFPEPYYYLILKQSIEKRSWKRVKLKYGEWLPRNIFGTSLGLKYIVDKTSIKGQVETVSSFINESYLAIFNQLKQSEVKKFAVDH